VYLVSGNAQSPQYTYSIGLFQSIGFEIVLAGASFFSTSEQHVIVNKVAEALRTDPCRRGVSVVGMGVFRLNHCESSWATELLLGAIDFYDRVEIPVLQIIPDEEHLTIDVPDMGLPWSFEESGAWQWLKGDLPVVIPINGVAITNLGVLQGEMVIEVVRWEANEWEAFSIPGTEVTREQSRQVPITTLLIDDSLLPILGLIPGEGLRRDSQELIWTKWERQNE